MGYDFFVTRGCVRLAEINILVRKLIEFGAVLELDVIPIHWTATGTIPDYSVMLNEIFHCDEMRPFVSRPSAGTITEGTSKIPFSNIEGEHIQGVVLCHPYEEWVVTWNVSRGGLLAGYCLLPNKESNAPTTPAERRAAAKLLTDSALQGRLFQHAPAAIKGSFREDEIHLHCPWRKSDASQACDLLSLLSTHSDDFSAKDDFGIWPTKNFEKWNNWAEKWARHTGGTQLHPDGNTGS